MLRELRYPNQGTKKRIILDCLIEASGRRIPAFELGSHACSISVHSVISKLRIDYGWRIVNKQEHVVRNGQRVYLSYYSLPTGQAEELAS